MSTTERTEPEEVQQKDTIVEAQQVQDANYNPLAEAVSEKAYSRPNITLNQEDLARPIPEPIFNPPPINPEGDAQKPKDPIKPFNPEISDLPNKDKQAVAENAANMALDGYEFLHSVANQSLQVSEGKIMKLRRQGEIDFRMQIPYNETDFIGVMEFFQTFNSQVKDSLTVDPEFRTKVFPVLVRVLQKRAIGMSDEQLLIYYFGKDFAYKFYQFISIKSTMRSMIGMLKDNTAALREQGNAPQAAFVPQQPPQNQAPPPRPPQEPIYQAPPEPQFTTPPSGAGADQFHNTATPPPVFQQPIASDRSRPEIREPEEQYYDEQEDNDDDYSEGERPADPAEITDDYIASQNQKSAPANTNNGVNFANQDANEIAERMTNPEAFKEEKPKRVRQNNRPKPPKRN